VLLCFGMLEIGLRAIGRYRLDRLDGYFAQTGLSYGLRQNVSRRVFWPTFSFVVNTDQYGARAKTPGPRQLGDKPYYAILGSSEVFGNGLDYEKTFVGVFADKMATQQIEIVNLAVAGHHLSEQEHRLREFIATVDAKPSVVVINLNPLLIGGYDVVGSNVIVRQGELFDRDNWRLAFAKVMLANASAVYCFLRDSIRKVQLRYFQRPDYSLDFYVERYSTNHPIRRPEKKTDFLKRLEQLEDYIRSFGAVPVVTYVPTSAEFLLDDLKQRGQLGDKPFDTEFFGKLAERHSAEAGVKFINFRPLLRKRYLQGHKLNFDLDAHFDGPTSLVMGDFMYSSFATAGG
jgi:hypothetical protein